MLTRSVPGTAAGLGADAAAYQRLYGPLARDWPGLAGLVLAPIRRPPRRVTRGMAVFGAHALSSAAGLARRFRTDEAGHCWPGWPRTDDAAGQPAHRAWA